jgi:hypothetical protein
MYPKHFFSVVTALLLASNLVACAFEIEGGTQTNNENGASLTGRLIGAPCTSSEQCSSNGNDAVCLTEEEFGQPGGSCSEVCHITTNVILEDDCLGGGDFSVDFASKTAICQPNFDGATTGKCQPICRTNADCRNGYACVPATILFDAFMIGICEEACTNDTQCPTTETCDPFTGASFDFGVLRDGTLGGECI